MNKIYLSCFVSVLILLHGCQQPVGTRSLSPTAASSDFKVIGYLPGRSVGCLVAAGADPMKDEFDSVYYNGMATIKEKTGLAIREGLAGVMIWEISQDTQDETSLLKAINDVKNQN